MPRRAPRRIPIDLVVAVFAGGCVGGLLRYAAVTTWPADVRAFPWSTLLVNVAGAFVLGLLLVYVEVARPHRYMRALVGTGFCGALTTFGSVVVAADELVVRDRAGIAAGYVAANLAGGLLAALIGVALGRLLWADAESRGRGR